VRKTQRRRSRGLDIPERSRFASSHILRISKSSLLGPHSWRMYNRAEKREKMRRSLNAFFLTRMVDVATDEEVGTFHLEDQVEEDVVDEEL
jgi:hypothetical protein